MSRIFFSNQRCQVNYFFTSLKKKNCNYQCWNETVCRLRVCIVWRDDMYWVDLFWFESWYCLRLKKNNLQLLGEVKCFVASEFESFMKRWYALSWFVLIRKLIGLRLKKKTSKIVENVRFLGFSDKSRASGWPQNSDLFFAINSKLGQKEVDFGFVKDPKCDGKWWKFE